MNKQELIEKIESLPSLTSITSIRPYVDKKIVLGLVRQLDEPQKVVVPNLWRIGMKRIRIVLKRIYIDLSIILHRFLTVLK